MQYDLRNEYDAYSVTPRDFTIVIDPLPGHLRASPDELSLQLSIKKHLDSIMADSESPNVSGQIALISFAHRDEPLRKLQRMRDVKHAICELIQSQATNHALNDGRIPETKKQNKETSQQRIKDGVDKMKQCVEACQSEQMAVNVETQLNEHDQVNIEALRDTAFGQTVERAYITFNSMKAKVMVEH